MMNQNVPAPQLSQQDLEAFQSAFDRAIEVLKKFKTSISERDKIILEIGLRSSHIEEALAGGELDRAQAHFKRLDEAAQRLVEYDEAKRARSR